MKQLIVFILSYLFIGIFFPTTYGWSQQSGTNNIVNRHILNESGTQSVTTIQYYDVLGREYQQVKKSYTPTGKDLVYYQNKDALNRLVNESLPVSAPAAGNPISWSSVQSLLQSQYGDASAYSDITYEDSGLNRPVTSYGPGVSWKTANRSVKQEYTSNISGDASLNAVCFTAEGQNSLKRSGNYATGSLYVIKTTGEDNEISYEFRDKSDRTILIRKISDGTSHDTYYVWNELGFLVYILPPLATDQLTSTTTYPPSNDVIRKYAYYYEYDGLQRVQAVQQPGIEVIYNVYDKGGRIVLKQDGVQRATNEWTYFVYDALGRIAEEGLCISSQNLSGLRSIMAGIYMKVSSSTSDSGYNTASVLPSALTGRTLRKSIFYDNYSFRSQAGFSNDLPAGDRNPKGKSTGSVLAMEGTDQLVRTVIHYDAKGRICKQISSNHLGGLDTEETTYTFTDTPLKVIYIHTVPGKSSVTQQYDYTYDGAGRLTKTTHKLNGGTSVILAELTYDEYDRVKTTKLHGGTESVIQNYNLRGWTTGISSSHFTETLGYNTVSGPLYNGNIRSMSWKSGTESTERGYLFTYNGLNFLTSSTYGEGSGLSVNAGRFNESQTYDKQGNILTQQRSGKQTSGYGVIDNLTFTYNGNQVQKITDAAIDPIYPGVFNFADGANESTEYLYDGNGRTTVDKNAGISKVSYTRNGTPSLIQFTYGHQTNYLYDANGGKCQVKHVVATENQFVPMGQSVSLPTSKISSTITTDYCGNVIYENGILKQIQTPVGFITLNGNTSVYHYYLRDHQGNNRVVINQSGTVEQVTHYFPFGMTYGDGVQSSDQPFKYNGKELDQMHSLNWYDYEARMYAGYRFPTPDPLADKYPDLSPYAYCANNPVNAIDPGGKLVIFINGMHSGSGGTTKYWDGFDKVAMTYLNDFKAVYRDGSIGGVNSLPSNNSAHTRMQYGALQGSWDAYHILKMITDDSGNIKESIKIITHSMGAAYAKGYVKSLLKYFKDNNLSTDLIEFEADFAPYQPDKQSAVEGIDTYQFSHLNDWVAGYDRMRGATYMDTKDDKSKTHSISGFINQIFKLPSGNYRMENGIIIKN